MAAIGCLLTGASLAQSPVTLTIDTHSPGLSVPADFAGFSFEAGSLKFNNGNYTTNGYFFNSTNTQLLTFFRNVGIKGLRIGGNSSDGYVPLTNDIDTFFGFVRDSGVKVIYSLRLQNGDPLLDASIARYVWNTYRTNLHCLAIGNEPNSYNGKDPAISNVSSYIARWEIFASNVTAAVPDVVLGGPDNGNGATTWASGFAQSQEGSSNVAYIFSHYEPGGSGNGKTAQQLIDDMLSPSCDATWYPSCNTKVGVMAQSLGFAYRFTEFNSHVAPTNTQMGNHSFATALFALDALHWWAAQNCLGLHFHTGLSGFNAGFFRDANGHYEPYPICYGIATFSLGGYGNIEPLTMANPDGLNLAAYAVADSTNLYVTIINKEHGSGARNATVTIAPNGFSTGNVAAMFLTVTNGDVSATNGVMLGGAAITDTAPWLGQWTALSPLTNGQSRVTVLAGSAAVVRIQRATVNLLAPNLACSLLDTQLTLSWPVDHTGWRLLTRTNPLAGGAGWSEVLGSKATNRMVVPIGNSSVFYRLVYP